MSVNTSIGLIGVAEQSDASTAAEEPTYVHGLTGGQTFKLDRTVDNANVTCGIRANTDSYVSEIVPGVDFETYGYSDVLPLYAKAVMGSISSEADDTTDASYVHTVTMGDELPSLTFWGRIGNEYTKVTGAKVDQFEMDFEGNAPLNFGITVIGMDAELGLDSIPGDVDPSCFDGYYVPTGGTFMFDTISSTPSEEPITSGNLSMSNSCTAEPLLGQVMPGSVDEGKLSCSGTISVKPSDASLYRKLITGSEDGTVPTGTMVYGSFEWNFTHSKNEAHTLTVTSSRVPFSCDFPSVDPDGGAATFDFSFDDIGVDSRDGSPVTMVFRNDTASYETPEAGE